MARAAGAYVPRVTFTDYVSRPARPRAIPPQGLRITHTHYALRIFLSSTSAELPVYELSILTPEQMAAKIRHIVHRPIWTIVERVGEVFGDRLMIMQQP